MVGDSDQPGNGRSFAWVEPVSGLQRREEDGGDDVGRLVGVAASCDRVSIPLASSPPEMVRVEAARVIA